MRNFINQTILRNRYTLLLTVLLGYMSAIIIEGELTHREPQPFVFNNPYMDLDYNAPKDTEDDAATEANEISVRRLLWGR